MARGRRFLGQFMLVVAMMVAGFVGAKLGMVSTREVGASHNFSDVPDNAFYHGFVQFLVDNGITAGCAPDQFCGEDAVTRGQTAVFLKKLSDLVDQRVQAKLATVLGTTPCMRREGNEVIFEGCNVHVRSGAGETRGVNGLGNLIVGYNEQCCGQARTGSHNLIVGQNHGYLSYGGLVAGEFNTITGVGASVTGGSGNTASGLTASVSGGLLNTASGQYASVSGGNVNTAGNDGASVSGGKSNTANGAFASVSGGFNNTATGEQASVSGGHVNTASGSSASVTGGQNNTASGFGDSVSGGQSNLAIGGIASVSGGANNVASAVVASVSGGLNNTASGHSASVSGGQFNTANGTSASVTGGQTNTAGGFSASVSGGSIRTAVGDHDWAAGLLSQDF